MSLNLRSANFGQVFNSSGARNFFPTGAIGNGWRQHKLLRLIPGYSWDGATFIAKTTTLEGRLGHLDLRSDLQPKSFIPGCVYVDWRKAIALNDVSLSGSGAEKLLDLGIWQELTEPFLISFMSVAPTPEARLEETIVFCKLLKLYLNRFRTKIGLEINDSCPNAGHDPQSLIAEAAQKFAAVREALPNVPLVWKINALTSPWIVKQIVGTGYGIALSVSNTIPWQQNATWAKHPKSQIDWQALFGTDISPLKQRGYGNGGLSGWPLLNLVAEWVATAINIGIATHIKAGGGIQRKADIRLMIDAGADAIELGCVGFLRPWRLRSLINYGNRMIR